MPIEVDAEIRKVSQDEFAQVAYETMRHVFDVRNEMGRLFNEKIYKNEIAARHGAIELEVPIVDFDKSYRIDMLASGCAAFEVKTAEALAPDHRAQLINYLLLSRLPRGKFVNVYPDLVQHEFVNVLTRLDHRSDFEVDDCRWRPVSVADPVWKEWFTSALRDWGTGLDVALYNDAVVHVLGGKDHAIRDMEVRVDGRMCGVQKEIFTGPESIVKVTTFPEESDAFERNLRRFVEYAQVEAVQWVNVGRQVVMFRTVRRGV
jgi:GxxExxY protein